MFASLLQPYVDDGVMAGAVVLVADKDRVLHQEAVGFADLATRRTMQIDDLFWIASITKPVTGAALMMLVDEGRVRLDEPVSSYIPEFEGILVQRADGNATPPARPPTLRELLSHTGGLRFLNSKDSQKIDAVPLATCIAHNLLEPLLHEPGEAYLYSNEGIDTIGRVIEIVTGEPFERFLQERLFDPLGMADTTFFPTPAQLRRLATSYEIGTDGAALVPVPIYYLSQPLDRADRHPAPGGGLFSTANDLSRFARMLLNEGAFAGKKFLSPNAVREMTTKQTPPHIAETYGLGVGASEDGRTFGHGGAYKTNLAVEHGQIRVFLVQHSGEWARDNPGDSFRDAALKLRASDGRPDESSGGKSTAVGGGLPPAR